ncbi:hypothetical protein D7X94_00275 [Acutalibacter sp. 1XD8-33]|uniref:hypothetical protein n=1 Tax=Acutalibacter sp. 1XD8-33 TaxID=2320081 RepID=UPI000EA3D0EF|nr:hypothetical protein [Acutalibacter sp. 1XD8-33]RKJ41952.1 hypothetical protein D7X94_00275 [Acutalibacter sp. 1XD8-33]
MIKVEISGENPLEVFAQAAVYGVKLLQIPEVSEASDLVLNMEKHWKATKQAAGQPDTGNSVSKPTAPTVPPECDTLIPEPEAPAADPAPEKAPSAEKIPTMEEVRAAGVAAGQKYGNPKVKAILKEMGVAKMSELAEGDRAVFLQNLESLGDGDA